MPKHGKRYNEQAAKIDSTKLYAPVEAAKLAKETASAKFDESIEVHFRLGIDPRKADQNIRGSIALPHGTGKTVRVAVFAEGDKAREAEAAGADVIGSDELVAAIQKGEINFDAAIATPNMMDVAKMVSELKAGRVEYRADRYGICHIPMGKASFELEKLVENYGALMTEILRVKPSTAKGRYVKSVTITSTMGPGIKVDPAVVRNFMDAAAE